MRAGLILATGLFAVCITATVTVAAGTPAQQCEAGKNKAAGKYAACLQKAAKGLAQTGDATKHADALALCEAKRSPGWTALETAAVEDGGVCPSVGDSSYIAEFLDECSQSVAAALGGQPLADNPVTCGATLDACENAVAGCEIHARPLRTGLTACYGEDSYASIPCTGTGQDGELQLGIARSFTDNGETVTDNGSGLMWEKLSLDGSIHDAETTYTWTEAVSVKIAALNSAAFAGYTDWRLPNFNELRTLRNLGAYNPAVFTAFETGCVPGCTIATCNCSGVYYDRAFWSSTSTNHDHTQGYTVEFSEGLTGFDPKTHYYVVRAVRGGA